MAQNLYDLRFQKVHSISMSAISRSALITQMFSFTETIAKIPYLQPAMIILFYVQ